MSKKVLFVDDEPSLLNGVMRRLGADYEISIASSGLDGLAAIEEHGPFPVVVTDMRMPGMDGISFVKEARLISPDSTYIMLTGNQDQATATNAVNEGAVFRFLNKPCENSHLRNALDAGLRQHELVTAEKTLLRQTFVGAVNLLTDLLEASDPAFCSCASRVDEVARGIRRRLGLEDRWEFRLSSRVNLLGVTLMSDPDRDAFTLAKNEEQEWLSQLQKASEIGERLLSRIPRLASVAAMVGAQARADGTVGWLSKTDDQSLVLAGANVLRVATHADRLARWGNDAEEGIHKIATSLPNLAPVMEQALVAAWPDADEPPIVTVPWAHATEGMVLAENVMSSEGAILVRQKRRLTQALIEKLRAHEGDLRNRDSVKVYEEAPEGALATA